MLLLLSIWLEEFLGNLLINSHYICSSFCGCCKWSRIKNAEVPKAFWLDGSERDNLSNEWAIQSLLSNSIRDHLLLLYFLSKGTECLLCQSWRERASSEQHLLTQPLMMDGCFTNELQAFAPVNTAHPTLKTVWFPFCLHLSNSHVEEQEVLVLFLWCN